MIREGGYQTVSPARVLEILEKYDTIAAVRRRAAEYCEVAVARVIVLPESPYKRALVSAADWIVDRRS